MLSSSKVQNLNFRILHVELYTLRVLLLRVPHYPHYRSHQADDLATHIRRTRRLLEQTPHRQLLTMRKLVN